MLSWIFFRSHKWIMYRLLWWI